MPDVTATIRTLHASGMGVGEIIEQLDALGVPPPGAQQRWHRNTIYRIIGPTPKASATTLTPPAPTLTPALAPPPTPLPPPTSLLEDLERRLIELDRVAKAAETDRSWNAAVAAHRAATILRREIEEMKVAIPADPITAMSMDELRAIVDNGTSLKVVGS